MHRKWQRATAEIRRDGAFDYDSHFEYNSRRYFQFQ